MFKKKSGNCAKCLTYVLPQAQAQKPAWWGRFPFLFRVTEIFCKIESKFLNSKVLAGCFVMGCAKSLGFLSIYKKVVESLQDN